MSFDSFVESRSGQVVVFCFSSFPSAPTVVFARTSHSPSLSTICRPPCSRAFLCLILRSVRIIALSASMGRRVVCCASDRLLRLNGPQLGGLRCLLTCPPNWGELCAHFSFSISLNNFQISCLEECTVFRWLCCGAAFASGGFRSQDLSGAT